MKRWIPLLACCALVACVADPHRSPSDVPAEKLDPQTVQAKSAQIHLDLIRDMIANGQYYAALAYLQDAKQHGNDDVEVRLLEADTRRHLGQNTEAEALYRRLLGGPVAGPAYHGLGMLYVKSNLGFAIANMRRAAQISPTDPDIRNDLGRALMEAGRYNEAMPELSTAAELAPNAVKSRKNLIVLMLVTGDEARALAVAQQSGVTPADLQKLRAQATSLKAATPTTTRPAANKPAAG